MGRLGEERDLTQETPANTPITEMVVNSIITAPPDRQSAKARRPIEIRGLAWDGGYGITRVEVSVDGGSSWRDAALGNDLGRFAFRQWTHLFTPPKPGSYSIIDKASNRQTQTEKLISIPPAITTTWCGRSPVTVT